MFVRGILIGIALGLMYAGAWTQPVIDWLMGWSAPSMFGSLTQSVEGQVRNSVAEVSALKVMVGAMIVLSCMVLSSIVWPLAERVVLSVGSLMSKVRFIVFGNAQKDGVSNH